MNVLLQRHCARYIYVVPEGLRELMSDISREVIRSQPENTYLFIADYLDALMITRENARVAARLVQSITEITTTTVEFLQQTGMDRAEADNIVRIIQTAFKKHIETQPGEFPPEVQSEEVEEANIISDIINEANISPEEGEDAALIIQRAFRQFKLRKQKEKDLLSGMIDWRAAARSAIQLYRHTGVTVEEANRAATMIKAAYKGYYTRRLMKQLADESKRLEQRSFDDADDAELETVSEKSYKAVTINYETVIPHVDFDESKALSESTGATEATSPSKTDTSGSSVVVASALERILEAAFLQSDEKEVKLIQLESDVDELEDMHEVKEEHHEVKEEHHEVKEEHHEETEMEHIEPPDTSETEEHSAEIQPVEEPHEAPPEAPPEASPEEHHEQTPEEAPTE